MLTLPDRLTAVMNAIEHGERIDVKRIEALQALDIVRFGRQFVEEAIKKHEEEDDAIERLLQDHA